MGIYHTEKCWDGTQAPPYFAIVGPGTGAPYDSELYAAEEKDAEIMAQCAAFGYLTAKAEVQDALRRSASNQDAQEAKAIEAQIAHLKTGQRLIETAAIFKEAVKIIRQWHGMGMPEAAEKQAWEIYWKNAPEMAPIREFQEKAKAELESLSAPIAQEERDFTPEEALAEARKRWGRCGIAQILNTAVQDISAEGIYKLEYRVGRADGEFLVFYGKSFRAAFAAADKAAGIAQEKEAE
jgi:hypothetical protein